MVLIVRGHMGIGRLNYRRIIMRKKDTVNSNLWLTKVGLNIRKARIKKGLSQESLALAANLDRSYVGSVERGKRNIAIVNLKKIANTLKIPLAKLVEGL